MNLVDSSGWLEYFTDGKNVNFFVKVIENSKELIVSTINIYEVYKKILSEKDENSAIQAIALMQSAKVINVGSSIAVMASRLSYELKIPMADSIIYSTARLNDSIVWTQDADFKDLEGVRYFEKE